LRLLMTGANGFIGSRLAQQALADGLTVRTLTRREWSGAPLVAERERFFGEFPFQIPIGVLDGVDVVVHCAATTDAGLRRARAINVTGTMRLAEAARDAGVGAFIMLSSQSARADAPAAYGRTKHEAEQALLALSGITVTILRPGLVCGRGGLFGRILRSVERSPVVPVIGGESPVQPLFVGDLVQAILRIARERRAQTSIVCLGSRPVPLGELIGLVARTAQSRKVLAPVPATVLAMGVGAAERVGLPLPVSSTNIAAMRTVQVMDTDADMQALGLPNRTPAEIVRLCVADRAPAESALAPGKAGVDRPSDTLLVGGGRIGLVHAITLSRLSGSVLAGVADRSAAALRLLASTGITAPMHASLDAAVAERAFDAAVLATPPASHLALARQCTSHGMAVLIEKPACVGPSQIPDFEKLDRERAVPIYVGYLMPGMPHLAEWIARLKRGDFGRILSFDGFSLLSLIQEGGAQRWETRKEVSGGGVLANSAGHVISLIREAFGDPVEIRAETRRIVSTEVEDVVVARLEYGSFSGMHYSCWCIEGFPRQENRLVVKTDRGTLYLTISLAAFFGADGHVEQSHQLDHDVGFNLAPDYAGGGISRELQALAGAATGTEMSLDKALGVERLLFATYAAAREVPQFDSAIDSVPSPVSAPSMPLSPSPVAPRRVLDIRELDVTAGDLQPVSPESWPEVAVYSHQLGATRNKWLHAASRVTVPNLLHQTRLIGDKRYVQLVRSLGPSGVLAGAQHGSFAVLRKRNAGFWVAVTGLLAAELTALPPAFNGTLLLHPYVVDLALALGDYDSLEVLLGIIRRERPHARVGLHSNLAEAAGNAVATLSAAVDELSILSSPNGGQVLRRLRAWLGSSEVRLTAEVGPAPLEVHRLACCEPTRWAEGPDAVMIAGLAEPAVFQQLAVSARRRWAAVFGTIPPPDSVW
jgi:NADH dehydrogenase